MFAAAELANKKSVLIENPFDKTIPSHGLLSNFFPELSNV